MPRGRFLENCRPFQLKGGKANRVEFRAEPLKRRDSPRHDRRTCDLTGNAAAVARVQMNDGALASKAASAAPRRTWRAIEWKVACCAAPIARAARHHRSRAPAARFPFRVAVVRAVFSLSLALARPLTQCQKSGKTGALKQSVATAGKLVFTVARASLFRTAHF